MELKAVDNYEVNEIESMSTSASGERKTIEVQPFVIAHSVYDELLDRSPIIVSIPLFGFLVCLFMAFIEKIWQKQSSKEGKKTGLSKACKVWLLFSVLCMVGSILIWFFIDCFFEFENMINREEVKQSLLGSALGIVGVFSFFGMLSSLFVTFFEIITLKSSKEGKKLQIWQSIAVKKWMLLSVYFLLLSVVLLCFFGPSIPNLKILWN